MGLSLTIEVDESDPLLAGERSLVERARAGDRAAAETLATESYRMIFRALVRLTGGNRDLAADLTQETYRKAWQSIGDFQANARFSSWLYRIAHNTFLNSMRTPRRLVALDDAVLAPIDGKAEVEDDLFRSEEGRALRRAVFELPAPLQFVVTAHYWADLSIREIAEGERVTVVAIRKRLSKALLLLERKLRDLR